MNSEKVKVSRIIQVSFLVLVLILWFPVLIIGQDTVNIVWLPTTIFVIGIWIFVQLLASFGLLLATYKRMQEKKSLFSILILLGALVSLFFSSYILIQFIMVT